MIQRTTSAIGLAAAFGLSAQFSPLFAQARHVAIGAPTSSGSVETFACRGAMFPVQAVSMGRPMRSVLTRDLNRDGYFDLLTASSGTGTVAVRLGRRGGDFYPVQDYSTLSSGTPGAMATGDFDGDGFLDLAVATNSSQGISFLRGFGDGTFAAPIAFAAGRDPRDIAAADLDGDGHLDIAITNDEAGGSISVLLGGGDGTFAAPVHIAVGPDHGHLAATDLDGNGQVDLVAVDGPRTRVRVLWNSGGVFTESTFAVGQGTVSSLATGDLDRDGHIDVVVGNRWAQSVSVLRGAAGQTLSPGLTYDVNVQPDHLRLGDLDRDGLLDIVAAGGSTGKVAILMGDPSGFHQTPAIQHRVGSDFAYAVDIVDAGGDGDLDVVVAGDSFVTILDNRGTGSLEGLDERVTFSGRVRQPITADLNGDGLLDVAMIGEQWLSVHIRLGTGDGTFAASGTTLVLPETSYEVRAGDLEGDGDLDLLCSASSGGVVIVFTNQGGGVFAGPVSQAIQGLTPSPIDGRIRGGAQELGDFNGDGLLDLAFETIVLPHLTVWSNGVAIATGDGTGGFTVTSAVLVASRVARLVSFDMEGDGDLDLAITSTQPQGLSLIRGDGLGGLGAPVAFPIGFGGGPRGMVAADMNDDGFPDVLISRDGGGVSIHFNSFGLGFSSLLQRLNYGLARSVVPADVNLDGRMDVVITGGSGSRAMSVFTQDRAGGFSSLQFSTERGPIALLPGDFDLDGDVDILSFGALTESMTLHRNSCK